MIESLNDLQEQLSSIGINLYYFYGSNAEIMEQCILLFRPSIVFFNKDYTHYAFERDK